MKKIIVLAFLITLANCSKKAQIVMNSACVSDSKNKIENFVPVLSEPKNNATMINKLKPGTVVEVCKNRNHQLNTQREFVWIKSGEVEGWVSPRCLVVNQDPANSVFNWGYRPDFRPFFHPKNTFRYPNGYSKKELDKLPKTKIPLEKLVNN